MPGGEAGEAVAATRASNRIEQLDYIRSMIRELRTMAAAGRFEMLTLHLEMAYLEASDQLRELHSLQTPQVGNRKRSGGDES